MVTPIRCVQTYGAAVAQNAREDILVNAAWAHAAGDEVIVLELFGVYGAVTATIGLYRGSNVITEEGSACDATTFGNDWSKLPAMYITLTPNQSLRCFMKDSAADPLGLTFAVKGAIFKTWEV